MRLENTDSFRNKYCRVEFKNGTVCYGKIIYIPNFSEKYYFHKVGWFATAGYMEVELHFKDIQAITPAENLED